MLSRDLAFGGDLGGHRGVVAAEFDFGFGDLDGSVGFDFEVYGLPGEDRRVDPVYSLGYQVVAVRTIIGVGVVANSGLIGLGVLHRV